MTLEGLLEMKKFPAMLTLVRQLKKDTRVIGNPKVDEQNLLLDEIRHLVCAAFHPKDFPA